MMRSFACWTASGPTPAEASGASSVISAPSALTSHGWPRVSSQTSASASGLQTRPVSAVSCARSARVSAAEKSPSRSETALTLNALPPATRASSVSERIR